MGDFLYHVHRNGHSAGTEHRDIDGAAYHQCKRIVVRSDRYITPGVDAGIGDVGLGLAGRYTDCE